MKAETYNLSCDTSNLLFSFFIVGKKGIVTKVVVYEPLDENNFNLAFGDYDIVSKTIDDLAVSNNGDTLKVLSTVVRTLSYFFEEHPNASVFLKGSTPTRTKLYQRIIKTYRGDFEKNFDITAAIADVGDFTVVDFDKNYVQFCIKRVKHESQ